MKKHHKIFIGLSIALAAGSCTDMDQFPQDKLNPGVFFGSETELELYTKDRKSVV